MSFEKHVSVVWDFIFFLDVVPFSTTDHNHIYTAPPPVLVVPVPFGPSVEIPVPIAWPPGALLGDHKLTSSVYHNHVWFALEEHDCGHGIMHLCVPPTMPGPCVEMPLNIMFSSRKSKFSAGEVKANGSAVGICTMFDRAGWPTPMLICGTIPVPAGGSGMSWALNSLVVGMHWIDMAAGWVDVVVSMIRSGLMNAAGIDLGDIAEGLGINPIPEFGSLAGGLVRGLGQEFADYHGDAKLGYSPVNGPLGGYGVSVTRDGATGDVTAEGAGGLQAGGLVGGRASGRRTWRSDGSVVDRGSVTGTTIGGGGYERGVQRMNGGDWESTPSTSDSGPNLPWSEGTEVPFL